MALVGPPPLLDSNPFARAASATCATSARRPFRSRPAKLASRWRARGASPSDPLPLLLESYERFGPIFTLRLFHGNVVFMLGPAANHYITVSHASNFTWRDSHFRDLIGLMGDGLLTIDGDFHRRSRLIMLPALPPRAHRRLGRRDGRGDHRALEQLAPGERDRPLRVDPPARAADRDARALRPRPRRRPRRARSTPPACSSRRSPSTPPTTRCACSAARSRPGRACSRPRAQLDTLIYSEISSRRATGERGEDILSLLLDAHDEDGTTLTDLQIRDEVMTLMFAGHDTTTSTVAFMFYELAHHPEIVARLLAEQDAQLVGRRARPPPS